MPKPQDTIEVVHSVSPGLGALIVMALIVAAWAAAMVSS